MRKIHFQRFANAALAFMAVMATVFANMPCRGKCFEPVVPDALKEED